MGEQPPPIAIDPYGCACTECITGEYVSLDQATDAQLAAEHRGELRDHTRDDELALVVIVRRRWGGFERELDPQLLNLTINRRRS